MNIEGSKKCLIRQPSGLGDIIFTLKIAEHYKNLGYDVIWPVIDSFTWLSDYISGYTFYSKGDNNYNAPLKQLDEYYEVYNQINPIFNENFVYLPLQSADKHFPNLKIMQSKYRMVNLDYSDWVNYFNFSRNLEKENELFIKLGLSDDREYCLVSRNYGSPPNYLKFPMDIKTKLKTVELGFVEGYTLFDWSKVIENAKEMYLIDSSINYLIDKLDIRSDNLNLYSRRTRNWSEIDYIFNTKYNLIN